MAFRRKAAKPQPVPGDYFRTNPGGRSVCKAYTAPPSIRGHCICQLAKGIYIGPVSQVEISADFVTIEVRGYWINVWSAVCNAHFAEKVPQQTVDYWVHCGWQHEWPRRGVGPRYEQATYTYICASTCGYRIVSKVELHECTPCGRCDGAMNEFFGFVGSE